MKRFTIVLCLLLGALNCFGQDDPAKKAEFKEGEACLTFSTGLMFPSTGGAGPKQAIGLGGLIGGKYFLTKELEAYGNLGLNRIFKNGYRQTSLLMYVGSSYYLFSSPFRVGGELGLNFIKEKEINYSYWYSEYYAYYSSGVSLYLAGVLGYEVALPFGRLTLDGRLGLTYQGLFIAGNVGFAIPVFDVGG